MIKIKLLLSLLVLLTLTSTSTIFAAQVPGAGGSQGGVNIGDNFKMGEGSSDHISTAKGYSDLGTFFSTTILPNILVVAGIILFFLILLGGFTMITGAGNPDSQKKGSQILTASLIGFILIFGTYWIMQILGIIVGFDLLNYSI